MSISQKISIILTRDWKSVYFLLFLKRSHWLWIHFCTRNLSAGTSFLTTGLGTLS